MKKTMADNSKKKRIIDILTTSNDKKKNSFSQFDDRMTVIKDTVRDQTLLSVLIEDLGKEFVALSESLHKSDVNVENKVKEIEHYYADIQAKIKKIEETFLHDKEVSQSEIDRLTNTLHTIQNGLSLSIESLRSESKENNQVLSQQIDKKIDTANVVFTDSAQNLEKSLEVIEQNTSLSIEALRKELLLRMEDKGGSMNRQIRVEGVDVLTKYTDINLYGVTSSVISSVDMVNKRVNIGIQGGVGGGGGISSVLSGIGITIDNTIPSTPKVALGNTSVTVGTYGTASTIPQITVDAQGRISVASVVGLNSGGTPGGSNTQVQYNDSSAFGGDANFTWDKTHMALGIGTATPKETFHIIGNARLGKSKSGYAYPYLPTITDNPLTSGATTINVSDTTGFPSYGTLQIEIEIISYTGITATSFTGCARGILGSTAASHAINTIVGSILLAVQQTDTIPALLVSNGRNPSGISNTSVGINTFPTAMLDVYASGGITDPLVRIGSTNQGNQFTIYDLQPIGFNLGISVSSLNIGVAGHTQQIYSSSGSGNLLDLFTAGGDCVLQSQGVGTTNRVYLKPSQTVIVTADPSFLGIGTTQQTQFNTSGLITKYNNITTVGNGVPAIYGNGRSVAQTAAVASVATYTVGAADGSFLITANVNVTTSTAHSFTVTCAYTDETNTARTLTLSFIQIGGGTPIATITNVTGVGPYEGVPNHIRCKASTAITIATTGTFTTVTYNVESSIIQIA